MTQEDILVRAMSGHMGCCDCDGNKSAFQECGMEISRLRHELTVQKACTSAGRDEIARLRLTDEEREAVEVAAAAYAADHGERFAAVLRRLLERLHK